MSQGAFSQLSTNTLWSNARETRAPAGDFGAEVATTKSFEIGQTASYSKTITEQDILSFANLSGDFNPVHIFDGYAKSTMFGERIAHGILTASLISAVLGMQLPGPGCIY